MPLNITSWLITKYNFLKNDAARKGFLRSISENCYEYKSKKKFKAMGVVHPNFCKNLPETISQSAFKDAHENQPSSFYSLNAAFRKLDLNPSEISMVDIGCGSGRVLSFGMLLGFKAVYGVDLDKQGLAKAQQNGEAIQRSGTTSTTFHLTCGDATLYVIPKDVNVIFLFNPYGEKTMAKTVENIINYSAGVNRDLYVIYSNPTCKSIFENNMRFRKIFESFFRDENPDINIYQLPAEQPLLTPAVQASV